MAARYVLALDQGTTSSRSILFDHGGNVAAVAQREFRQIYPQPGWVEHDPYDIWNSQLHTAKEVLSDSGASPSDVAAIGIANQRETTVLWDRATGVPIHNAIVWQCRRTADRCNALKAAGLEAEIRSRSGLVIDAYFSGTKIAWLLDHVEGARVKAERGELCFGTVDCWLLYKLTGRHATDYTNACRTMLFNVHDGAWDDVLLEQVGVPRAVLPEVLPTSGVFATTSLFGGAIPVAGMAGDQQAALFGQAAFEKGQSKNTYGTGCFLVSNTGTAPVSSERGLLTSIAWNMAGETVYALEGSIFVAGAVIQWLRDELGLIGSAAESEAIAASVPDTQGVYLVPAFVGLGAPYWNMEARGILTGLTRGANRAHIVRAALESMAYQSAAIVSAMQDDTGAAIPQLRVDGGAAANDVLLQHQADVLGVPVLRGKTLETTALGAAYFAGLAAGFWKGREELVSVWKLDRAFEPKWTESQRQQALSGWDSAVRQALS